MSVRIKDLHIPDALYNQLKERAEQNHRTVEDELIEAASAGITNQDNDRISAAVRAEQKGWL